MWLQKSWSALIFFINGNFVTLIVAQLFAVNMPSAGAIFPPRIVVLRDSNVGGTTTNKIDSETYIELTCGNENMFYYFLTESIYFQ